MKKQILAGCMAMAALVCGPMAGAQDLAVAGRKVLESNKDAVIKVKVVLQQKMLVNGTEGHSTEETKEISGTVIDPSGLVVVALSAVDPSRLMESILKNVAGGAKMDMKFQVKDVKLLLPDETEVEASVVLRDKDLDLAFIRPTLKPSKPMAAINLSKQARPQVLDDVLLVMRLSKVSNHEPSIATSRVTAIVRKPRLSYILQAASEGMENIGTPVLMPDGRVAGILVMRMAETHGGGGMTAMLGGMGGMGLATIVLPAADVLEASKQATEAKADKPAAGEAAVPKQP